MFKLSISLCNDFRRNKNLANERPQLERLPFLRRDLIEREICFSHPENSKRFIDSHSEIWKFSTTALFRHFAESSLREKNAPLTECWSDCEKVAFSDLSKRGLLTGLRAGEKKAIQVGVLHSNRTAFHGLFIELRPRRKKKMRKIRLFSTDFLESCEVLRV